MGEGEISRSRTPRPIPMLSYPLQQRPVLPPQPPDASIGARSSHRASLACALRRPPEPTRRGCGARLAPGRGTRSPTGGRRRGPLGEDSRQRRRARHSLGRGGRLHATLARLLHRDLGADTVLSNRSGTGGTGPDPSVGWNRACSDDKIIFRDGLFSTVASSTLGPPSPASKGQDRDRPQTPGNPKEDSFCPTCSSSSESEPEGFFFGQRLPGPWKTPENLQADDRDISRKHCTIC